MRRLQAVDHDEVASGTQQQRQQGASVGCAATEPEPERGSSSCSEEEDLSPSATWELAKALARKRFAEAAERSQKRSREHGQGQGWAGQPPHDSFDAERSQTLILPRFLSPAEVDKVHAVGGAAGVTRDTAAAGGDFLALMPEGFRNPRWKEHVKVYLHRDGEFSERLPEISRRVLGAMRERYKTGDWGTGSDLHQDLDLHVRCVEYHTYKLGGGLVAAGHCDAGSALTLAVMLSDPRQLQGSGQFVTFTEGEPVVRRPPCLPASYGLSPVHGC
jgi:hypothetical protein